MPSSRPGTHARSMSSPISRWTILRVSATASFRSSTRGRTVCSARKRQELPGQVRRALRGPSAISCRCCSSALPSRRRSRSAISSVAEDDLQHVVEIVRDPARELPHGLHLERLAELLLRAPVLGDVDEADEDAGKIGGVLRRHRQGEVEQEPLAPGVHVHDLGAERAPALEQGDQLLLERREGFGGEVSKHLARHRLLALDPDQLPAAPVHLEHAHARGEVHHLVGRVSSQARRSVTPLRRSSSNRAATRRNPPPRSRRATPRTGCGSATRFREAPPRPCGAK